MPENQDISSVTTTTTSSISSNSTINQSIIIPASTTTALPLSFQLSRRLITVLPNNTHQINSAFQPPPPPPAVTPEVRERSPRPTIRSYSPGGQGHTVQRISASSAQRFLQPEAITKSCNFCTLPLHYCILCSAWVHHTLLCCSHTICGICNRRGHVTGLCPNHSESERQPLN